VNMGRGTSGARAPIRVATDAAGEPSVAIADYQSEADEDAQAREKEESKRLLYVALTRARDRLYLSATVQDGQCRMTRGSLGEVLPSPVKTLFVTAWAAAAAVSVGGPAASPTAPSSTEVSWAGHTLLVPAVTDAPRHLRWTLPAAEVVDDFGPL
jgi:hypothetical protein